MDEDTWIMEIAGWPLSSDVSTYQVADNPWVHERVIRPIRRPPPPRKPESAGRTVVVGLLAGILLAAVRRK